VRRRVIAAVAGLALVAAAVLLVAAGGGGGSGRYLVRAVFDNANFVIPGEDVKVAGVKAGKIDSLDLTAQHKAVVVLRIDDPAFKPFRRDAHCQIRPQSLIGEQFVECEPTQPRAAGAAPPPELVRLNSGRGKGQYLLPVENTTTPVALDLIGNTLRLPYRQRLTLIINELGAGLAGNGQALRQAIRRADPALHQADRVLAILAGQNRTLADLARNSDIALAPLARERARAAHFITTASATGAATAARGAELERDLQKLPGFLRALTPTARQLGDTASQMTPALESLRAQAPAINTFVQGLGPFSTAALPAFRELSKTADVGSRVLTTSKPVIDDLASFGNDLAPLSTNLSALATSFKNAGGVERALDTVFYLTSSENGYDSLSHYLRAGLVVNLCSTYAVVLNPSCEAFFRKVNGAKPGPTTKVAVPRTATAAPAQPAAVPDAPRAAASPIAQHAASRAMRSEGDAALLDFLLGDGGSR
jgi:phospholipid/cholesterol/gamma-HCH transport system substrate-binding protein